MNTMYTLRANSLKRIRSPLSTELLLTTVI
nr:MAG TPA: hypothetical protein [Caudoviricetes sp.]